MTASITHKRGASFRLKGKVALIAEGEKIAKPQDLTDWVIKSQIRKVKTLVATLLVTKTENLGEYRLESPGLTPDWPLGDLAFDVAYQNPAGQVVYTETVVVHCVESLTEWT